MSLDEELLEEIEHSEPRGVKHGVLWLVLLIAALWLWHGALLWCGEVLAGGDIVNRFVPMRMSQLTHGWFSPWLPETFSGRPLTGNIEAAVFYPPNWLMIAWPDPAKVITVLTLLHLFFGAIGFYALGRCWFGRTASALAAFLWTFGGYQVLRLTHGVVIFNFSFAWVPWMLLAAEKQAAVPGRRMLWTGLLAIFGAMQILAGAAQIVQITWVGIAVWQIGRLFRREERHLRLAGPLGFVVGGVVALLLALPQLIPALEFQQASFPRGGEDRWAFLSDGSLNPRVLLTYVFPEFYAPGVLEVSQIGPVQPGQPQPGIDAYLGYWGSEIGYHETNAYLGVLPLLLALVPLTLIGRLKLRGSEDFARPAVVLCAIGLFAFVVALGKYGGLFWLLVKVAPTFDYFRVPARWMLWPVLAVALLAAWGLELLLNADEEERRAMMKRWLPVAGGIVLIIAIVRALVPQLMEALNVARSVQTAMTAPPFLMPEAVARLQEFAAGAVEWALFMGIVGVGAAAAFLAGRISQRTALVILLLVMLIDLRRFWVPFTESMPLDLEATEIPTETPYHRIDADAFYEHFYPETPLIVSLQERMTPGRVHYTETLNSYLFDQNQREFFAERPMAQGIEITRGYQALQLGSYVRDYYASLQPVGDNWSNAFLTQMSFRDRRFLDAYNVTEILTYEFQPVLAELARLGIEEKRQVSDAGVYSYHNPHARGWAWLSESDEFLDAEPTTELGEVDFVEGAAGYWYGSVTVTKAPVVLHLSVPNYGPMKLAAAHEDGTNLFAEDSRTITLTKNGQWSFERWYQEPHPLVRTGGMWAGFAFAALLIFTGMFGGRREEV